MLILNLFFFALSPLMSMLLVIPSLIIDYKNRYFLVYIIMISIALATIGFHVIPEQGLDAYTYNLRMNEMQYMTYDEAYSSLDQFKVMPVVYTFFYIIAQTGILSLAPFISVLFTYSAVLYCMIDYARKSNLSRYTLILAFMVILSWLSYISTISGMRFNMGFSMLVLALYREFIEKKGITASIPFYIMAVTIHTSLYAFVLIRILLYFYQTQLLKTLINIILITWSEISSFAVEVLTGISGNVVVQSITDSYHSYEDFYKVTDSNAQIYLYLYWSYAIAMLIVTHFLLKDKKNNNFYEKQYYTFIKLVSLMCIGSYINDIYILRFTTVLIILSSVLVLSFINQLKDVNRLIYAAIIFIWCFLGVYNQKSILYVHFDISLLELIASNIFNIFG